MSREVTGTGPDDDPRPSPLAALLASPRGRLLAAAGVLVVAVAVTVAALHSGAAGPAAPDDGPDAATASPTSSATPSGAVPTGDPSALAERLPAADGLTASLVAAGRDGADLTSLDVRVAVDNARPAPVTLAAVQVVGLGTTIVEARDGLVVPAGDRVYLRARVTPDCAVLQRRGARVVVTRREPGGGTVAERVDVPATALDVLDPLCPAVRRGLAVRVVATVRTEGGTALRIVNHGTRSALVTPRAGPDAGPARLASDPPLPYDLAPGEALVARLRVVSDCRPADPAAAAEALFLEAETPDGFTAVTGFPTAAVRGDLEALTTAARCPASP